MGNKQRYGYDNEFTSSGTTITASSEETSFTAESLRDNFVTKQWRSDVGWNIGAWNNKLDFTEIAIGDKTATIASGNYATGAAMATAIESAMDSVGAQQYTVTYGSNKFTIARDVPDYDFNLEWSSGANTAVSIGEDIGFDVSADDTGAASYQADNSSYKSREWVKFDLAAAAGLTVVALFNTNGGASDAYTIEANAADVWTSPSYSQALSGTGAIRIYNMSAETYRWWRILIEDTANTDGYSAIGIAFGGSHFEPARGVREGFSNTPKNLSEIVVNDSGGIIQLSKGDRQVFVGRYEALSSSDEASFVTLQSTAGVGGSMLFELDPANDLTGKTYWMVLAEALDFKNRQISGPTQTVDMGIRLVEQIG
jgi:hypothetical protein